MRLLDQFRVEVQVVAQSLVGFCFVDLPGHQDVGGIVVAFGLNQALIESTELTVRWLQRRGEDLKLFAASALDQTATDQVVHYLETLSVPDGTH